MSSCYSESEPQPQACQYLSQPPLLPWRCVRLCHAYTIALPTWERPEASIREPKADQSSNTSCPSTPRATSTSSLPRRSNVSRNSYPSAGSSTLSQISAYASLILLSAVRWICAASRESVSRASLGEEAGSMVVRNDEKVVREVVSSLGEAAGSRESGVYLVSVLYTRGVRARTSGGRERIARKMGPKPH